MRKCGHGCSCYLPGLGVHFHTIARYWLPPICKQPHVVVEVLDPLVLGGLGQVLSGNGIGRKRWREEEEEEEEGGGRGGGRRRRRRGGGGGGGGGGRGGGRRKRWREEEEREGLINLCSR